MSESTIETKCDCNRRDFLTTATIGLGAAGLAATAIPLVDSMNPAADTQAISTVEVDLSQIAVGQSVTVTWRGRPVFIRHRTPEEIAQAVKDDSVSLRDQQTDAVRVQRPDWLIVVGICTHLGCIPLGQKPGEPRGEFGGWFCPCHGSQYDTSGRARKGPAPSNLVVPPYAFVTDTQVKIG
ncbi:ubiquinol-cytochrome c reductase iron-sulfur subunit [Magnetospirillum molischianum]|uniref:Ubiquinol-cytochrome c reductase iron-sulfur subunit n=1 Tax=Magnetospirillum molischianum DSM 120 TaxID=1150626 RepID=H8FVN0_MAGML|nr:ubiquinol-cytochrome c reductase iron-sulfur subunit [Magnetospirillum molischianum]CCG42418.1 Ubiquinol-cytochrome c reductase iron-sulfur subunit [Magnetospirillum molischianum DSM 120]